MAFAPRVIVQVEGARELRRTLRKAGDDLSDMKAAHTKAAGTVLARQIAPARTGTLAATVRGTGTKTAAIIRAGYARVPYANPIHWGWPARNIAAQPWISEAAQGSEAVWYPVYVADVQRITDKVKGA